MVECVQYPSTFVLLIVRYTIHGGYLLWATLYTDLDSGPMWQVCFLTNTETTNLTVDVSILLPNTSVFMSFPHEIVETMSVVTLNSIMYNMFQLYSCICYLVRVVSFRVYRLLRVLVLSIKWVSLEIE